jgi:Fur family ferric uptake transcriptional regulator
VTSAPQVPRLAFEDIDDAIEALRARGLRLSTTRQLVLDTLFAASAPLSAEEIAAMLQLVATTVYRNLETLERHGLLHHVHLGHGPGLYALAGRGPREYIYCPDCSTGKTVRPELLDPVRGHIKRRFGYEVSFTHFALVGICQACAARRASASSSEHPGGHADEPPATTAGPWLHDGRLSVAAPCGARSDSLVSLRCPSAF